MPLPEGGAIPWPPKDMEAINHQYEVWAAWYAGDMEQLSAIYGGDGGTRDSHGVFASEAGGFKATVRKVFDNIRRWFWSARTNGSRPRNRLHVPIAADMAAISADLLFSEPPSVKVPVEEGKQPDKVTQARLDELMDDGMHATLLESAEIAAALGGVYLRVVWDKDTRDCPWITAVHPDSAVPEWRWGDLAAVTFWRVISKKGKTVIRHLERHEKGLILHGVYQGDDETLGQIVSLADYPETKGLAEELAEGNEIRTGATGLAAVYVPNMKPNRLWRNVPHAANLGRSDYAGVEPLMDALDLVYSSWMRDVDLGKARLIVPREYLRSAGPGEGATVDLDQEIYEGINAMSGEDGKAEITQVQFAIRVDDHQRTVADIKTQVVTTAGYSGRTFGLGAEGQAVTATEIAASERRSIITRDRKTRYYRPKLGDIYFAWLEIDAHVFSSGVKPVRPQIDWRDAVSVDPLTQAEELNMLHQARAISTQEKVKRLRPDWTPEDIDEEVKRIEKEDAPPLEDPNAFNDFGKGKGDGKREE